ncbi:hypothetical protein ISCGN_024329 [Ixodes scapularis]
MFEKKKKKKAGPPRIEPATTCVQIGHLNLYATPPLQKLDLTIRFIRDASAANAVKPSACYAKHSYITRRTSVLLTCHVEYFRVVERSFCSRVTGPVDLVHLVVFNYTAKVPYIVGTHNRLGLVE